MENNLELINDNSEVTVYRYSLADKKIILLLDKSDQVLYMPIEEMAKCLGYKDETVMLSSDIVLDILSAVKKQTGKFPILDNCLASVSLLRKIPMK